MYRRGLGPVAKGVLQPRPKGVSKRGPNAAPKRSEREVERQVDRAAKRTDQAAKALGQPLFVQKRAALAALDFDHPEVGVIARLLSDCRVDFGLETALL